MDPSLLEYARFHGIASDYAATNPLTYIDNTFKLDPNDSSLSQTIQSNWDARLHTSRESLDKKARGEKLSVSKGSARFLTSLIREVQAESIDINWDEILPDFHRFDDLRVEVPIFPLKRETDVKLSKKPLRYTVDEIERQLDDSREKVDDPNASKLLHLKEKSLIEQVKNEKIKCSRESFSLIQSVRSHDESCVEELGVVLDSMRGRGPVLPETPDLQPLSNDDFLPSPALIPDEYVLPSPVSAASIELDLYWRHKFFCVWRPEETREEPVPSTSIQQDLPHCSIPTQTDEPPRDIPGLYTERPIEEGFSLTELYTKGKDLFLDAADAPTRFPADDLSSPRHDNKAGRPIDIEGTDREGSTTESVILQPQDATKSTPETSKESRECQLPRSEADFAEDPPSKAFKPTFTEPPIPQSNPLPQQAASAMTQQPPRTRVHTNELPPKQVSPRNTGRQHESEQKRSDSHPSRMSLGSLSVFMETRGKSMKKQVPAQSPYFACTETTAQGAEQESKGSHVPVEHQQKPDIPSLKSARILPIPVIQAPRVLTYHEGLVLFLSTALLKTHLPAVQCLEGTEHGPNLIYRDYADTSKHKQARPQAKTAMSQLQLQGQQSTPTLLPPEADIILSPKTAIILTTSQATMQLYLPGHKSTILQPNTPTSKSINSPLRETIFRLASRYEQLYVFITHNPDQSKRCKSRVSNPQLTADKHLLTSLTSLSAFCTSLSAHGCITPLIVPSIPESICSWILALAHKHICQVPPSRSQIHSQYSMAFTPVNPKPQLGNLLGDAQESSWEIFLRRAGLNPYAAQVVLSVLRREDKEDGREIGSLSRFVEMGPGEQRVLFGGVLGEMIMRRVKALVERDWQCDWALNFDDGVE